MYYELDDIIKSDQNIIIKGFILEEGEVCFRVENTKTHENLPCEVNRFKYKNRLREEPLEAFEAEQAGFSIQCKSDGKHLVCHIETDKKTESFRVRIRRNYSKSTVSTMTDAFYVTMAKVKKSFKKRGFVGTVKKALDKTYRLVFRKDPNQIYMDWLQKQRLSHEQLEKQRQTKFAYEPVFSIVVPLFETPKHFLAELISSVQAQTYPHWELCFSEGSRPEHREDMKKVVEDLTGTDARIKYVDDLPGPLGISSNTNQAISIATGDYIVLGDHDDLFTPDALFECVKVLNADIESGREPSDVIYTDEDKTDGATKKFFDPHFKSDFNLGFFRSNNYICHMFVVAKAVADRVGPFDDTYNGAQDYDYILRCTEAANRVVHIPKILYHWRVHIDSTAAFPESKLYAYEAGMKAVQAHYDRLGISAEVKMGKDYGYYDTVFSIKGEPTVSVIRTTKKMSVSEINHLANTADGEYLLFFDERLTGASWQSVRQSLLQICQDPSVGAVGAKILYSNETLCHAGVIVGMYGCCGAIFENLKEIETYHEKCRYMSDFSAVTGLCMMTSKEDFLSVGGFDEHYHSRYYDIDYCMRLRDRDKRISYQPKATLYIDKGRIDLWKTEDEDYTYFVNQWKQKIIEGDPYYNPNLSLTHPDYRVKNK